MRMIQTSRPRLTAWHGRWRVAFSVAAVMLVGLALAPGSAHAHAAFQDASPEPGARVESAPAQITIAFTEPLNHALSTARIVHARSGRAVVARLSFGAGNRMVLRPARPLGTGAYQVRWHTVSIRDGHTLEGSFGFGVRTAAVGGAAQLEQSPLARGGLLRVALRAAWYAALFFFAGGLLCGGLLASAVGPAGWLLPGEGDRTLTPGDRPERARNRIWGRTRLAGWLAAAAGVGVVLAETRDAAGSLSWHSIDAYLLSTASGGARALAVVGVLCAVVLANLAPRAAALYVVAALGALAVGGHANSASPRALAVASDWTHLVAAAIWIGGIAQIAVTWLPAIGGLPVADRRRVMRDVLDRFGRIALPAFAVVVIAGVANALIELGSVSQLWQTGYGRVLIAKIALVGAIGLASYAHAFVLRPGIESADNAHQAGERRHWRLLGSEPGLALMVVAAAALLVAFPLPPRQLLERAEAGGEQVAAAAPLRPPGPRQLAVAEEAGPWIAAAWVDPPAPGSATGTVRLLDYKVHAVAARLQIVGARTRPCGTGCVMFTATPAPAILRVRAQLGRHTASAEIPIRWQAGANDTAERILRAAVARIDRLSSFRIAERLTGGFGGPPDVSSYRIEGRYDWEITTHGTGSFEEISIGRHVWTRQPNGTWQQQTSTPFDTRELMPWWTHRYEARLLDVRRSRSRRVADVALSDIAPRPRTGHIPFWFRLQIDLGSMHVLAMRMITVAHFMDQHYYAFDVPERIEPPSLRAR